MGNRILLIGTVLFVTHVAFGEMLVALPQPPYILAQQSSPFEREIASALVSKGLEPQAAEAFAKESTVNGDDAIFLTNMIAAKSGIERKRVYDYVASRVLFKKRVDLRAYDDVVAMVQQIKGTAMTKKDFQSVAEYIATV